jgi:hypothetical protein
VLPADEDVAGAGIGLCGLRRAIGIVPADRSVDFQAKVRGQGGDGVVGTLAGAIYVELVSGT